MKQKTFLLVLTFFTLILSGCQQKAASKRSSTSNPVAPPASSCVGQAYWTTPGCTGYCQYNPTAAICNGGTTGTTAGGTTGGSGTTCTTLPMAVTCANYCQQTPLPYGCLTNGSNCNVNPTAPGCPGTSVNVNPYWGIHYPPVGTPPTGYCSEPYAPQGLPNAFATRKGTITLAGLTTGSIEYNPLTAGSLLNTSPMLKSVAQAKIFFMTDSVLKVRIKPKAQPYAAQSSTMCYGRNMPGVTIPGYTKLQYYVKVYAATAGNALGALLGTEGPFQTGVNDCSAAIDLSSYQEQSPTGVVIAVDQVKANQNCSGSFWTANGFANCNIYKNVRSFDCWAMDFEVAADGTKTFD